MTSKSYERVLESVLAQRPRWRAAAARLVVVAAVALGAVLLSFGLSWMVDTGLDRSVIVSAGTSRFDVELSARETTLDLRGVALCLPRAQPSRSADTPATRGCNAARSLLIEEGDLFPYPGEVLLSDSARAAWPTGVPLEKNFVLSLPQGTALSFEAVGGRAEILLVKTMPGVWLPPGTRLLMDSAEFEDLGHFALRGQLTLGTAPGRSSRGYLDGGQVEFRWHSLFAYSMRGPTSVLLRKEALPRAARVYFEDPKEPADMEVLFMLGTRNDGPERVLSQFEIDAVNHKAPTSVIVEQAGVRQVRLSPIWTDVLLNEPILMLAALLGGGVGFGALRRALRRLMERSQ